MPTSPAPDPASPFAPGQGLPPLLRQWREEGRLQPLALALVRLLQTLQPDAPESLLMAAALCSELEAQGHSCLPLGEWQRRPHALLGWESESDDARPLPGLPPDADSARACWPPSAALEHAAVPPDALPGAPEAPLQPAGQPAPLVLAQDRLYLRRYWQSEQTIHQRLAERLASPGPVSPSGFALVGQASTSTGAALDEALAHRARRWLEALFPQATAPSTTTPEPDWQQIACALVLRGPLTLITGGPGTGKTFTAARALALLQGLQAECPAQPPLRVGLAAPTGKAAARLRESMVSALQGLSATLQGLGLNLAAESLPPAQTLHRLLGWQANSRRFRHHRGHPLDLDVLFVDESSMIHTEMMAGLLEALPAHTRLILLGDKDQLASVEAGSVLGDLCAHSGPYNADTLAWLQACTGVPLPSSGPATQSQRMGAAGLLAAWGLTQATVALRHSRRFSGRIGQLALATHQGQSQQVAALLSGPGGSDGPGEGAADTSVAWMGPLQARGLEQWVSHGRTGASGGYGHYLDLLLQGRPSDNGPPFEAWALQVLEAFGRFRVLCALREGPAGVQSLNPAIEQALRATHGLPTGQGSWYEGRPVMVTRNEAALGLFNGDIGIALRPPSITPGGTAPLRVYFAEGERLRSVATTQLSQVETAFALTIHKSQGSEFGHVLLVLPPAGHRLLSRELVYTGITRARQALSIVADHPAVLLEAAGRPTVRSSGLAV